MLYNALLGDGTTACKGSMIKCNAIFVIDFRAVQFALSQLTTTSTGRELQQSRSPCFTPLSHFKNCHGLGLLRRDLDSFCKGARETFSAPVGSGGAE